VRTEAISPGLAACIARVRDFSIVIIAATGVWFFWSQYSTLSGLSWWYENVQRLKARTVAPNPDYELTTLPWQVASPLAFDVKPAKMTLVTSQDSFGYQAFATVSTLGANAADIQFDADLETGGATIGMLQRGKWIASSSSREVGAFSDSNSARLGYSRSLTVMIANNNPAGVSRLTIKSLRIFLRK
jgi:hypothetical protein